MITIGTFTKTADGRFQGAIRTLTLNAKGVEIRPVERTTERGPDHRIFVGQIELGAAWTATKPDRPTCLSVEIDDPSFAKSLKALLAETADGYELRWMRVRT